MADLDDIINPLRVYAQGASRFQLRQAYLEAARKFFQETTAWREEMSVASAPSDGTFTLSPIPGDVEAFEATGVWYKNTALIKATRAQFQGRYSNGSMPKAFRVGASNTLHVAPAPREGEEAHERLTVIAALRPVRHASVIDDEALKRFEEPLLDGARWKLLAMPDTWGNSSTAEYYRKLFQEAIAYHTGLAADDGQVGVIRRVQYGGY